MTADVETPPWPEFESRPTYCPERGFVRTVSRRAEPERGIEFMTLEFDIGQFDPCLFDQFGIGIPDSVQRAVPKRQAEFLAGRLAARWSLEQCGFAPYPVPAVPVGRHRAPVWPDGVAGSITHTIRHAICALCPSAIAPSVGIDLEELLEPARADTIAAQIHDQEELELAVRAGIAPNVATTLIFSAKESLFKALYPRVGEYFGFEQARLREISTLDGRLALELRESFRLRHSLPAQHECRFALGTQRALTLIIGPPAD